MNSYKKLFISTIVFFVIILGIFVIMNMSVNKASKAPSTSPSPSNTYQKEYKTKFYSSSEVFFGQIKYEDIFSNIQDTHLIPLFCSENYSGSYENTDPSVLNYSKLISDKYPNNEVYTLMICSSREGQTFVIYMLGPCGGGCYGRPYVGLIRDNTLAKTIEIPNELHTYYYGCSTQPLQLTTDGKF